MYTRAKSMARALKYTESIVVPKNVESHATGPFNFDQKSKSRILITLQSLIFLLTYIFLISKSSTCTCRSTVFHTLPSCAKNVKLYLKGIFQPFELGGETILIRSAVKH